MKLSLSGFLFEDNYKTQSLEFPDFCALAKSAGYGGVELRRTQVNPDTPATERKEILSVVTGAGLEVTCLTARGMPAEAPGREEFFMSYLDLCRDMDCGLMKISADTAWLRKAAEKAEACGVGLATNNHVGTRLETIRGTRDQLAEVAHPNYGLLYDSLHLNVSGEDYLGCIEEFFPTVKNILIHSARPAADDGKGTEMKGNRWVTALPDAPGVQDWPGILRKFKALGYDGLITVIESGWPVEEREGVARHCAKVLLDIWN